MNVSKKLWTVMACAGKRKQIMLHTHFTSLVGLRHFLFLGVQYNMLKRGKQRRKNPLPFISSIPLFNRVQIITCWGGVPICHFNGYADFMRRRGNRRRQNPVSFIPSLSWVCVTCFRQTARRFFSAKFGRAKKVRFFFHFIIPQPLTRNVGTPALQDARVPKNHDEIHFVSFSCSPCFIFHHFLVAFSREQM